MLFLFTASVQPDIDKYHASSEEEKDRHERQIYENMDNLVYRGSQESWQDYRDGMNYRYNQGLAGSQNNQGGNVISQGIGGITQGFGGGITQSANVPSGKKKKKERN